jgi:hypothetical protein
MLQSSVAAARTSTNGPTTPTNTSPELRPNTATATAIASSKLLPATPLRRSNLFPHTVTIIYYLTLHRSPVLSPPSIKEIPSMNGPPSVRWPAFFVSREGKDRTIA